MKTAIYRINLGKAANLRIKHLEKWHKLSIFAVEKRQIDLLPSILIYCIDKNKNEL